MQFLIYQNFSLNPIFWGIAQPVDIVKLLDSVIASFYTHLDPTKISAKPVLVCNARIKNPPGTTPEIIQLGTSDIIFLATGDLHWAQYAYQFIHELCHREVDSSFYTGIDIFGWFEESLCELASLYVLKEMAIKWLTNAPYSHWNSYAVELDRYSSAELNKSENIIDKPFHLWLSERIPALTSDRIMRAENLVVATQLFPIFSKNPDLWQSIQYIKRVTVMVDMDFKTFLSQWKEQLPDPLKLKFAVIEQLMVDAVS